MNGFQGVTQQNASIILLEVLKVIGKAGTFQNINWFYCFVQTIIFLKKTALELGHRQLYISLAI